LSSSQNTITQKHANKSQKEQRLLMYYVALDYTL